MRLLGLAEKRGPRSEPVTLEFEPGQYSLKRSSLSELEPILEELRKRKDFIAVIEHTYGSGDLPLAEELANPTREECRQIVTGLRRRKWSLLRRRSQLAADVGTSFALEGEEATRELVEELRHVEAELGRIEGSLDEALSLLRRGSERSATRRTRFALQKMGQARNMALQERLESAMKGDTSDRVEIRRPRLENVNEDGPATVVVRLEMIPEG